MAESTSVQLSSTLEERDSPEPMKVFGWGNTLHGELGVGGIEEDHISSPTAVKFPDQVSKPRVCSSN